MRKLREKDTSIEKIVILTLCAGLVLLFVCSAFYVVYSMDDICFMWLSQQAIDNHPQMNRFMAELTNVRDYYMGWQGTFLVNGLVFYVFLLKDAGMWAFHLLIALVIVFFFAGLFFAQRQMSILLCAKNPTTFAGILFLLVMLGGMNSVSPDEFFFWITGAVAYVIPMAVALWGMAFMLRYTYQKQKRDAVLAGILGFIACGGTLVLAAFVNAVYLFLCLVMKKRHAQKRDYLPFLAAFLGALTNSLAPGNFVHHAANSSGSYPILSVAVSTLLSVAERVLVLIREDYLVAAVSCLILFMVFRRPLCLETKVHPIKMWLYILFVIYIMIFPNNLGYGGSYFPDRVAYMVDIVLSMLVLWGIAYTTQFLLNRHKNLMDQKENENTKKSLSDKKRRKMAYTFTFIIAIDFILVGLRSGSIYKMTKELLKGQMKEYYVAAQEIYAELENTSEETVVLHMNMPDISTLKKVEIYGDPSNWVNNAYAMYYGKKSIRTE